METDIYYFIFFICSIYFIPLAGLTESDFEAINYTPGRDGYYDDETPANWVDTLFGIFIIYHHFRYAYKFTDYSLMHIHPAAASKEDWKENKEKAEEEINRRKSEQQEDVKDSDDENDEKVKQVKLKDSSLRSGLVTKLQTTYSTQSTNKTVQRPMHNTVCCCIPFAPRFFTWERTYLIRQFLKLFLSLSCLLSVVLYLEFAMNFFVEFIITCIVHYSEGYPAALLVLPAIIFMFDTFIRLSWQAVVVSWQFNGDTNGDLEVLRQYGGDSLLHTHAQKSLGNLIGAGHHRYLDGGDDTIINADSTIEANVSGGNMKSRIASGLKIWRKNIVVNIGGMSTEEEEKVVRYYTRILHTLKNVDLAHMTGSDTTLTLHQFKKYFKIEKIDIPVYIIKNVFCAIDADGNGTISAKEFMLFRDTIDINKVEFLATSNAYIGLKKQKKVKRMRRKRDKVMNMIEEENVVIKPKSNLEMETIKSSSVVITTTTTVSRETMVISSNAVPDVDEVLSSSVVTPVNTMVENPNPDASSDLDLLIDVEEHVNDDAFAEVKEQKIDVVGKEISGSFESGSYETESSSSDDDESPEEKKLRKAAQKAKRKRKALHRRKMGDFFLATCWRFGFFINTLLFTLIASSTINVEIAVNGLFFQLWMRYCVFAGCIWTFVYIIFSIYLQVYARLKTWKLVHESIPRWKFWFLVDAQDMEIWNNHRWMYVKMTVMFSLLFTGVLLIFLRSFVGNSGGFMYFVGIILLLYYILTVYLSCKPYALVALWTDNIPPPSESFFAHAELINQIYGEDVPHMAQLHSRGRTASVGGHHSLMKLGSDSSFVADAKVAVKRRKDTALEEAMKPLSQLATETEKREQKDRIRILTRYEKFNYECQDINVNEGQYKGMGRRHYFRTKNTAFHENYVAYWLNIYRPFDEYDIEANFGNNRILFGFQWIKPLVDCRCVGKRSKKSKVWTICKYLMDNMCNLCVFIFLGIVMYSLFYMAQRLSNNSSATLSVSDTSNVTTGYYSICTDIWIDEELSSTDNYYTIMDILYLVQIIYEIDNANASELIYGYFGNDLEIIYIHDTVPVFMHVRDNRSNSTSDLDFVTIRGTASVLEVLQDVSLFVEIGIFEGLQWIIPFLNGLPDSLIRQIIYYASQPEGYINADSRAQFDDEVSSYGEDLLESNVNPSTIHFMGHSLGGGIAEIVAANLYEWITQEYTEYSQNHIHSFGVCSPGVLYSSAKFGFGIEALDKTSSSLLPRRDVVSAVDVHGGSIQYVECSRMHFISVIWLVLFYVRCITIVRILFCLRRGRLYLIVIAHLLLIIHKGLDIAWKELLFMTSCLVSFLSYYFAE